MCMHVPLRWTNAVMYFNEIVKTARPEGNTLWPLNKGALPRGSHAAPRSVLSLPAKVCLLGRAHPRCLWPHLCVPVWGAIDTRDPLTGLVFYAEQYWHLPATTTAAATATATANTLHPNSLAFSLFGVSVWRCKTHFCEFCFFLDAFLKEM